jgi:hypothetical protein
VQATGEHEQPVPLDPIDEPMLAVDAPSPSLNSEKGSELAHRSEGAARLARRRSACKRRLAFSGELNRYAVSSSEV